MPSLNVRQMEIYIQQLEAQLQAKSAQVDQLNKYIKDASQSTQEIVNSCRKFCISILEKEIIKGTIKPNELQTMALSELTQRANQAYKNEQIENREILERFSSKLMSKNAMIQSLETQNAQLLTKNSQLLNSMSSEAQSQIQDDSKSDMTLQKSVAHFNDPKPSAAVNTPAINNVNMDQPTTSDLNDFAMQLAHESAEDQLSIAKRKENIKKNENKTDGNSEAGKFEVVDVGKMYDQISPLAWTILEIIGKEGTSEFPEIKLRILELSGQENLIKITQINDALKELKNLNAIDAIKINTGLRWFYAYSLQELGHKMFVDKFKVTPVVPEVNILSKEHDNPIHGYIIKDAAKTIQEIFQCNVSTSRKNNYIKLPGNKASVPDIIASKNNQNTYYEVETGHHTQADFNDKCSKLSMITNELYFIVPDQKICDKLKNQISGWIKASKGGREALAKANIVVYLTTMRQLVKKNWLVIFDMSSDDPIIRPKIGDDE